MARFKAFIHRKGVNPSLVLFSLIPVGFAANALAGAGGPLAA